jgi:hypothetical protein
MDVTATRIIDEGDEHDTTRFEGYATSLRMRSREWTSCRDAVGFYLYTCSEKNHGSHMAGGGRWPEPQHMSIASIYKLPLDFVEFKYVKLEAAASVAMSFTDNAAVLKVFD